MSSDRYLIGELGAFLKKSSFLTSSNDNSGIKKQWNFYTKV